MTIIKSGTNLNCIFQNVHSSNYKKTTLWLEKPSNYFNKHKTYSINRIQQLI